jgi:photosystem II stability/assembly factor-like uncharacterized protein
MAQGFTICVGTVGEGVWHSSDSGEHWRRSKMNVPFHAMPGEIQIRNLAVSPHNPHHLLAGSEAGVYRSNDNGANWEMLDSPMDGTQIWSVAWHPTDPDIIFVGTKPPAVYRSTNGGKKFEKLSVDIAKECLAGAPKVTNIAVDPRDPRTVWMTVEIDGVYRSLDGGDTWKHLPALGDKPLNQDIHGFALSPGRQFKLLATTPDGIWTSTDEGESWSLHGFPRFAERDTISYCRGVALKPDNPDVIFVGNGDTIPGRTGAIRRTKDGGATWDAAPLPVPPNSVIYWLATHPADPNVVVANSLHGYVYTSTDAGESWNKVRREFGEIRALAWAPN